MTKFMIYAVVVFCFGIFANNDEDIDTADAVHISNDKKPTEIDNNESSPKDNNPEDSAEYNEFLEVLTTPGPKQEGSGSMISSEETESSQALSTELPLSTEKEVNSIELVVIDNLTVDTEDTTPSTTYGIDHSAFGALLKKHVDGNGNVNYTGFKNDKAKLESYIELLSNNPAEKTWSKNERLAYYINVYNAYTIKLILDNYPVKSIKDINSGKPWDKLFIKLGSTTYSLNNIENDIIRKQFNEPRIHFAVNCAAKSCPPLLNDAFYPETLLQQLEDQTKAFINNQSYNQISASTLRLSKIFDWYGSDFYDVRDFIRRYTAKDISNASITFLEYEWDLNKQ